jgi:tripartite-type tricarboxylate transporter receptor subunit TctC
VTPIVMSAAAALACACLASAAFAQSTSTGSGQAYPVKTVRIISPTGPGGGADAQARLLARRLSESLGQPFFVDNRPGASGIVGTEVVAKSPPDGYTLLVTSSLIAVSAVMFKKLPFDPLRDLVAVSQAASAPQVLVVHPSVPAKSVKELVALARRQRLNVGSSGSGSVNHIAAEMFRQAAGIPAVTHVPYKSGMASTMALMSGEVDYIFAGTVQAMPILRSNRGRALAVTSLKRAPVLPDVPTMDSVYPGFVSANWYGMFAPGATPPAIVSRLHSAIVAAMKSQEVRDFLTGEGAEPVGSSPQEFAAYLRSEIERYSKAVKAANLTVE